MENEVLNHMDTDNVINLESNRHNLASFLQQRAKGALIRARISNLNDMDAPTAYFFNLEKITKFNASS